MWRTHQLRVNRTLELVMLLVCRVGLELVWNCSVQIRNLSRHGHTVVLSPLALGPVCAYDGKSAISHQHLNLDFLIFDYTMDSEIHII